MAGVRIAFSASFSRNRFSLPISALFLTRVDSHSYIVLSRLQVRKRLEVFEEDQAAAKIGKLN